MRIEIRTVRGEDDLARVRTLFRAYAAALDFDLASQGFEAELAALPGRYAPPGGTLLLAGDRAGGVVADEVVGCVGVRPLATDGDCELKRLYVAPTGRGAGTGRALMQAAIAFAGAAGYRRMQLDTLPTMHAAIALYRALGFAPIPAPADDAGLGQRYFMRALAPG